MEKLIPLLNERHDLEWVLGNSRDNGDYLFVKGDKDNKFYEEQIISKKFGFIKWLVDNDKIDKSKYENILERVEYYNQSEDEKETHYYSDVDSLIMLLSISSSPIEDLISYLH